MSKKISLLIIFSVCLSLFFVNFCAANSNDTNINSEKSSEDYILYGPDWSRFVYLIDSDGKVVHTWKGKNMWGGAVYLLEDGRLIRSCGLKVVFNLLKATHGFCGRVEMFDWDGNIIWEYEHANLKEAINHDVEVLPNGNVLMIVGSRFQNKKAISLGWNPDFKIIKNFWTASIIEVEPTFPRGGNIVWEWHACDHFIQDFDPSKPNYGVVEDHPELLDINYKEPLTDQGGVDSLHINSLDYDEEFDQILLSMRALDEIWIIDHSTTTEEAAGHTGGIYGKGGDILYRWGNPKVYGKGDSSDKQLFKQHDANWIDDGLPGEGHITIFSNGENRPGRKYSQVLEIIPPIDENGSYILNSNGSFGPEQPIWDYTSKEKSDFYSKRFSSAQRLENGNTLICSGYKGKFFEVTQEKEIVWTYDNHYPLIFLNKVFQIKGYPTNYSGLGELK